MSDELLEEAQEPRGEEGRFAATWQNKAAGRSLRVARQAARQSEFAAALSSALGVHISATALSGWETGRRQVPAPVFLAAAMVSNQSLDAILGESGAEESVRWAEGLGLPARLESQGREIQTLHEELAALRQQYGSLYTDVIQSLTRAGVTFTPSRTNSEAGRKRSSAG